MQNEVRIRELIKGAFRLLDIIPEPTYRIYTTKALLPPHEESLHVNILIAWNSSARKDLISSVVGQTIRQEFPVLVSCDLDTNPPDPIRERLISEGDVKHSFVSREDYDDLKAEIAGDLKEEMAAFNARMETVEGTVIGYKAYRARVQEAISNALTYTGSKTRLEILLKELQEI